MKDLDDPSLRAHYGELLETRFKAEFRPAGLGARYLDFIQEVVAGTMNYGDWPKTQAGA